MSTRITDYIVEGFKRLSQGIDRLIGYRRAKDNYPISARDCLLSGRDYLHQDETKTEEPAAKKTTKKKVKARRKTTKKKTAIKKNLKKAYDKAGITIPYPRTDIHIVDSNPPPKKKRST